jgi:DNA-binding LytR/AlgR family response regulator
MLLKPYGFVRVNISYLVNCRYIRSLRAGKVELDTEEEITVSRSKREEVKHVYMEYARRKLGWK